MQMPKIKMCDADGCYYNRGSQCHANAITVGSECPCCETYMSSPQHGTPADLGSVGACHMNDCKFNQQMSCQAPGIEVGCHADHPDCLTFTQ